MKVRYKPSSERSPGQRTSGITQIFGCFLLELDNATSSVYKDPVVFVGA